MKTLEDRRHKLSKSLFIRIMLERDKIHDILPENNNMSTILDRDAAKQQLFRDICHRIIL